MARPLMALEGFFERLLERPAARLFRVPLQPVQLERRIDRAMDTGRRLSADRTYVPEPLHRPPVDARTWPPSPATATPSRRISRLV